ncbi:MurR/RpiR family transcriptional regulator [Mangrovicella endophytica]|uniref:MurR/RpiR family transcriptional regulator n=1 Tax=Mangrovicella endophytica TaxID=2066697 RepID=UPI0012FFF1C4|nr:MurR/RpiR family transcriptional regulator [Mangrovicella endophytica]
MADGKTPSAAAGGSVKERTLASLPDLSRAENRVAHALLAEYPLAGLETVARFAARAATSGPTILRFIGRIGFSSYAEFQDALRAEVQIQLQSPLARYPAPPPTSDGRDVIRDVAHALRLNMEQLAAGTQRQDFGAVCNRLADPARSVLCLGGRFSWLIATYLFQYLRELRPGVRVVRDMTAAWADDLVDMRAGDVLVVFDFRRYQRDVLDFTRGARALGAEVVLITDLWHSPIAAYADTVIPCSVVLPTAFDSGVGGLAIVELLVAGVVERLGPAARDRIAALEDVRKSTNLGS